MPILMPCECYRFHYILWALLSCRRVSVTPEQQQVWCLLCFRVSVSVRAQSATLERQTGAQNNGHFLALLGEVLVGALALASICHQASIAIFGYLALIGRTSGTPSLCCPGGRLDGP